MTTERRLFGTDGVRGEAGTFLTAELATALGRAATASLERRRPQVLIVRDTRESGPMLEAALAAGIAAAGGDALLGGVLPTPAAAILVTQARLRPRRGRLRLPQPLSATTGSSSSRPPGRSSTTRPRPRIEALVDGRAGEAAGARAGCAS